MDFRLTEEQRLFADSVRGFAQKHLAAGAVARAHDPAHPFDVARLMAKQGLLGITMPEADGGQGGTLMDAVLAIESVAAVCPRSADVVQAGNFGPVRVLAEFGSAVDAVQAAIAMQADLDGRNSRLPENRRMAFRIGVNLGDVITQGQSIYGDGVNVAARLERLADPGGVCVAAAVHDQVVGRLDVDFEDLGEKTLKNISGAWLADQEVVVEDGKITLYKVRMRVTFVLV